MITEQPLDRRSSADLAVDPVPERRSRWPWPVQVVVPVLGLIVSLAAAVAVAEGLLAVLGLDRTGPDPTGGAAVALAVVPCVVVLAVAIGVTALVVRLDGGRRLRDVIGRVGGRRHLLGLLTGLVISVVVAIGVGMMATATGLTRVDPDAAVRGPLLVAAVVGAAQAFALQGIPEELLFRGYLLRSLRLRPWSAVVVSAVAFGVIHLISSGGQQGWGERVLYLALPTGFALTAGALVFATGSVASAIGIHAGIHVATLVAGLLAPALPALALGDGPVVWLSTGACYALVAVLIMVRRTRSRRQVR